MLKASQKRTKRAPFIEASMSSTPASARGWLPTTPIGRPFSREKPTIDVLRVVPVHLEELAVVDDVADDVAHVVWLVRVVRDDVVEVRVHPLGIVGRLEARRLLEVVERRKLTQVADVLEALLLALGGEVRDPRLGVVGHRAAELLERRLLARHGLDHIGPRDEHVRGVLHHEDEVRHRGE